MSVIVPRTAWRADRFGAGRNPRHGGRRRRSSCAACCRAGSMRRPGSSSSPRCATAARRSSSSIEARPDVVVLDVEMPELDGISTLPKLLERRRDLVVIMASALTRDHAEVTLKALVARRRRLHSEARGRRRRDDVGRVPARTDRQDPRARRAPPPSAAAAALCAAHRQCRRRGGSAARCSGGQMADRRQMPSRRPSSSARSPPMPPRVLLIGASTGGPQALTKLVSRLDAVTDSAPILITQHMPATFTTILAEHLTRAGAKPVREAVDGEPVLAGTIYLAPGGKHMQVARRDGTAVIVLDDGPPVHYCKPAVDPLFCLGRRGLGLLESGADPHRHGHRRHRPARPRSSAAGGSVIAQDEATSVVWGMPGSAAAGRRLLGRAAARSDRAEGRRGCSWGPSHDPARLRIPAQAAEGALRPRAVGREALPGREPAAAGRAQGTGCSISPAWSPS